MDTFRLDEWLSANAALGACPACGEPTDYCQGHGDLGDPDGAYVLEGHDMGTHTLCHPAGCEDAPAR